jgi:hypothetical protein
MHLFCCISSLFENALLLSLRKKKKKMKNIKKDFFDVFFNGFCLLQWLNYVALGKLLYTLLQKF